MESQNFSNHRQWVKGFHFVLSALLLAGIIGSGINIYRHYNFSGLLSCILILLIFICLVFMYWYMRQFPIKAQDRAIRAEESLRYFIMTGKAMNNNLTVSQIAALRFSGDDEFLALVNKTVAENLSADEIKKTIKNWRADHHRV
ncbi:MAG: DUF6526 family protein [Bacteroidota bacterium]